MSLALIQESAKEVRRLAIAGSPLAVGDFRLKKLLPPLEQAGTKVPVFAQVAKGIGDLVNGTEADSAANLLSLSTLLNAILYTQGQSGAESDYRDLEIFATNCVSTRTPARVLKPLVQALTTTGGGRFEIIKSAVERGAFNDLRLIDPAIKALNDTYPEVADLVAEKILPAYEPGIVPRLKAGLDLKGKKPDARRLQIMHQLDPAGTLELCKTALETGSPEVRATAIACLGKHEECLPLVLEQAGAKNKLVRGAALEALAGHDRPEVTTLFTELLKGKALEMLAGPFRALRNRQVLNALLEEGNRVYELILTGDEEQIPRYAEILNCLEQHSESEVETFVIRWVSQAEKLAKLKSAKNSHVSGPDLMFRLADLLYALGSPAALDAILSQRELLPPAAFGFVLRSALRVWSSTKVFEEFSPLLGQNKGPGDEKRKVIEQFVAAANWDEHSRFTPTGYHNSAVSDQDRMLLKSSWDARWLEAAIKADQATLVCCFARPGHKGALAYLLKLGAASKTSDAGLLIRALIRCQYPEVTDFFLSLVTAKVKGARYVDYELQFLLENARHLPAADLPKLDAFAAKLDGKFVDAYLEALAPLRPVTKSN